MRRRPESLSIGRTESRQSSIADAAHISIANDDDEKNEDQKEYLPINQPRETKT
ncbi:hypothetical protein H5410_043421 [Solanum commersonii]|uniref:Uncharacterized protein n=1 Tax=Solanum commersonii TaxID=4109 RepID=A0A9J5XX45_SOLCO|nr:hypothetical protein H5410_043421 [Solanum commersonii]